MTTLNSNPMLFILEVSKFDKFNDFNSLQPSNIPYIFSTFIVLNLSSHFNSFNLLQLLNIKDILLTFDVSKFDKSNVSNSRHS